MKPSANFVGSHWNRQKWGWSLGIWNSTDLTNMNVLQRRFPKISIDLQLTIGEEMDVFSPKRYTRLLNRQKSGVLDEAWCFLKPSAQNGCFGVFWEPQAILGGLTHGRSWGQLPPMSRSKLTVRHRKSPIYKWRFSSLRKPSISMGHGLTMAMLVITWGYILRNSNVLTIWSIEFRNICSQPSCRKAGSKGNHILEATAKLHAQNILPFLVQTVRTSWEMFQKDQQVGWKFCRNHFHPLSSKFVGHMLAGLCGAHGKILWVQQIPKHQALLFVGTPKRGLSHFRPWLHNKLMTRWWHVGDMCCRNGAIHTWPTLIYQNLSMNKDWHDLHWSMRIHEESPSLQSAYQNSVWPVTSAKCSCATSLATLAPGMVVDLPLWKVMEFVSWDDDIPNIYGKKKCCWDHDSQYGSGSKPCTPVVHIKIAGIYGCSSH